MNDDDDDDNRHHHNNSSSYDEQLRRNIKRLLAWLAKLCDDKLAVHCILRAEKPAGQPTSLPACLPNCIRRMTECWL